MAHHEGQIGAFLSPKLDVDGRFFAYEGDEGRMVCSVGFMFKNWSYVFNKMAQLKPKLHSGVFVGRCKDKQNGSEMQVNFSSP